MMNESQQDAAEAAKRAAGAAAAELVEDGMVIGLGTGSTAHAFIDCLAERCRDGLMIRAVATSIRTERHAYDLGIPMIDIDTVESLNLDFDGADAIDPQKRMIKGGGGALLREKVIAAMSQEMVVLVDASKSVSELGGHTLPVEIIPFGYRATLAHLANLGFSAHLRNAGNDGKYVTDNGHYIADIQLPPSIVSEEIHATLLAIPGVVETGFFFDLAGRVIIGHNDGSVEVQS